MSNLIPRDVLFGNAEKSQARISPDGGRLAYLAPFEGQMSVWVCTLDKDDAHMIAHDPARPIPWLAWRGDSRHVLYLQDVGGNENYHLCQAAIDGTRMQELTPGEGVRCIPLAIDHRYPDEALVKLNARNPALIDVARIDLATGTMVTDTENPGTVLEWLADHEHVVRAALAQGEDGALVIRVRDAGSSRWRDLDRVPAGDDIPSLVAFSPNNRGLYVITAKGADAKRLVRYDLESGRYDVVLEDEHYDISGVLVDPMTNDVVAASVLRERVEWRVLDHAWARTFARLGDVVDGDLAITSVSADAHVLIVRSVSDAAPIRFTATTGIAGKRHCCLPSDRRCSTIRWRPWRRSAFKSGTGSRCTDISRCRSESTQSECRPFCSCTAVRGTGTGGDSTTRCSGWRTVAMRCCR